jgi:CHASE3 domain sensor protein
MTPSPPIHPRVPRGRSRVGGYDLQVIQRATLLIDDLGADLDRLLTAEPRATERLRLLRETTNRITRTANDAIQAYARARRATQAQIERGDGSGNAEAALAMRAQLHAARRDLLRALRTANRRYPWTDAPGPEGDAIAGKEP